MKKEIEKSYDAGAHEDIIYKKWEDAGYFDPDILVKEGVAEKDAEPFCIIMPPPNANGSLHIGHAVFVTLEDIMTRYARMQGKRALWLPGADHAGFETQVVYDKKLEKEGRSRFKMDRDELWQEIYDFTQSHKHVMEGQLRKLGASCDWSRNKFTLEDNIIKTVHDTFEKMYEDDLVYRADRMVNWCTKHQTSLSELETKHPQQTDALYYLKYGPITVATVRPEPIFADTAVAVHPEDARYKDLIGTKVPIPLSGKQIPVIADEMVDPEFGTGAVKVTPSVDPNDFEVAKRHSLEIIEIVDQFGKMMESAGVYAGMSVAKAREAIVGDLQKAGAIEKIDENYTHAVSVCYKCNRILEPRILPQWFVAMTKEPKSGGKSLRDRAVKAVKEKRVQFVPKRMEKIFMHWMENLKDWNISRQIVWGIRIPVWYKDDQIHVGDDPGEGWTQETDVFDTWFSSGQWPFATLQNGKSGDFDTFYPTSVMETGHDIIFFWVARMIMFGTYVAGDIPFKTVYLHGMVRDKDRQKMSKSKGNVIDPLGVVDQYGADALRMALIVGNTPGTDVVISEQKIKGYRNFANKIWNINRFLMMNLPEDFEFQGEYKPGTDREKEIMDQLVQVVEKTTKDIDEFKFYQAAEGLYHYVWDEFAAKIVEESKENFEDRQDLLLAVWSSALKMLHPFMPFVSEACWQHLPIKYKRQLIVEKWPS